MHRWIATGPAVCVSPVTRVAASVSAAPPQQRWRQQTGLCICATCSTAEKEQAKIWPTGKCWMFFETIEKCLKIVHLHWRPALLCCFDPAFHTVTGILLSAFVPVSGRRMNYQRNWVFFSSGVYGLRSVISFQLCPAQNSSQHDFGWKLENKAGFFL